eukprot:620231-Rhodomonas_salina.1
MSVSELQHTLPKARKDRSWDVRRGTHLCPRMRCAMPGPDIACCRSSFSSPRMNGATTTTASGSTLRMKTCLSRYTPLLAHARSMRSPVLTEPHYMVFPGPCIPDGSSARWRDFSLEKPQEFEEHGDEPRGSTRERKSASVRFLRNQMRSPTTSVQTVLRNRVSALFLAGYSEDIKLVHDHTRICCAVSCPAVAQGAVLRVH